MEIPSWFTVNEFYAIYYLLFYLITVYFVTSIIRSVDGIKQIKSTFINIKDWWKKRKESKTL